MLYMFQRHLGAAQNGFARQGSSDLAASPSALSRGVSRNNSFSRRAPAGNSGLSNSRSRTSLIVACNANNGLHDGDSASDANTPGNERQPLGNGEPKMQPPQQPQARSGGHGNSMRAPDAQPDAKPSSSSASSSPSLRPHLSIEQQQPPQPQSWDFSPEPYVPAPANLPTNEDEPEPLLFPPRPPLWTWTSQPGMDMFRVSPRAWNRLRQVFVILFGVGERETEGIYSLRAFSSDGTAHETIIAFECEEEAQRYAGLLEASMDHKPHVCSIPPLELVSFCLDQTYSCRLEPKGSLLIPPDFNVAVTDWERSLRLRDGKFAVLDVEPDRRGVGGGAAGAATATATASPPAAAGPAAASGRGGYSNLQDVGGTDPSTLARYSGLSHDELELIRARLETLLPAS